MPIAKRDVLTDKAPELGPIKTSSKEQYIDGITENGISTLSTHSLFAEGVKLVVDYYSGIRSDTMGMEPYSVDISPTLQTYAHIKDMELRADGDFGYNQIKSDLQSTLTGSALITGGSIVPQRWDIFVVNVSSNRKAVFNVTDVSKPTIHDTTSYTIEFSSSFALDDNIKNDLALKATHEYIYDRSLLYQNKNALISKSEQVSKDALVSISRLAFSKYMHDFYNKDACTFTYSDETTTFFDPYLVKFLQSILNVEKIEQLRNMLTYNVSEYVEYDINTFWDKLLDPSAYYSELKLCLIPSSSLTNIYFTGNLRYSNINYFVVPRDETNGNAPVVEVSPAIIEDTNKLFPELDLSNQYVFAPGLSTRDDLSVLEACMLKIFNGEVVTSNTVMDLYEKVDTLTKIQRFYYVPILMVMLVSGGI